MFSVNTPTLSIVCLLQAKTLKSHIAVFSSCWNGLCVQKSCHYFRERQLSFPGLFFSFFFLSSFILKCLCSFGFISKLQKLDLGFHFFFFLGCELCHLFTYLFSSCPQWHFSLSHLRYANNRAGNTCNCKAEEKVHWWCRRLVFLFEFKVMCKLFILSEGRSIYKLHIQVYIIYLELMSKTENIGHVYTLRIFSGDIWIGKVVE